MERHERSAPTTDRRSPTRTTDFLDSDDARPLRILAEYLEPLQRVSPRAHPRHDRVLRLGAAVGRRSARPLLRRGARARAARDRMVEERCRRTRTATSSARAAAAASWRRPTAAPPTPAAGPSASTSGCRTSSSRTRYVTPRAGVRVPLLLHAQAVVRAPGARAGRVSRRLRHARRADRNPDAGADAQARAAHPVVLYGSAYWNEIINFEALVRHGMIAREDLELFEFADTPADRAVAIAVGARRRAGAAGHPRSPIPRRRATRAPAGNASSTTPTRRVGGRRLPARSPSRVADEPRRYADIGAFLPSTGTGPPMIAPVIGSIHVRRSSMAFTPAMFSASTRSAPRSRSSKIAPSKRTRPWRTATRTELTLGLVEVCRTGVAALSRGASAM